MRVFKGPDLATALCDADGGAPLVIVGDGTGGTATDPKIVVGIYSFSEGSCDPTKRTVFTRLSVYYAWLARNAGSQPNCSDDPSPLPPST